MKSGLRLRGCIPLLSLTLSLALSLTTILALALAPAHFTRQILALSS